MGRIDRFSPKQLRVLTWWLEEGYSGILCDGAIRSGKTFCLTLSFVLWAMASFAGEDFAICARTIRGLRRNLLFPLLPYLRELGMEVREQPSQNLVTIRQGNQQNQFLLFGGKDEGSAALIQGATLAGVLLDEVVLMPRSFVEQALARCSVEGAKFWFSCNPDHPGHWFYREWVQKAEEKGILYLHFTMEDNPGLSDQVRRRYEGLYSGGFYRRYVLGEWCAPQGLVYPMFDPVRHLREPDGEYRRYLISCDYGTVNPCSMGLWGERDGVWHRLAEQYLDSRRDGLTRTDEELYAALEELAGDRAIEQVVVDPSAASFLACIRRHGRFRVLPADNRVKEGIQLVSEALLAGRILFSPQCADTIREFSLYRWDEGARQDKPVKEFDHAMDDIRYFAMAAMQEGESGFFAVSVERG